MTTSWRVIAQAGRADAIRLCRNPLVLASLLVAVVLIWLNTRALVPLWWVWDVQLGSILLIVAGAALIAAHLAAGRVRRDGAEQLYASFPAGSATRVVANVASLAGPIAAAALLEVAAIAWLDALGAVGAPRPGVLFQALVVVALGGAIGVAVASYLPSPICGILVVIVLAVPEIGLLAPGSLSAVWPIGAGWLFPWTQPVLLHLLPGPTALIPPVAHLAWLAAFTVLAGVLAVWRHARRPLPRLIAPVAMAACLAAAGWSGWQQLRPVPASTQSALITPVVHPASAQSCTLRQGVRYCAYPGFGPDVTRWATAVDGVLARLPGLTSRPARALVIRQVDTDLFLSDASSSAQPGPYQAPTPGNLSLGVDLGDRGLDRFNAALTTFISAQSTDTRLVPGQACHRSTSA